MSVVTRDADRERVISSATCLGCGCTCDDIDVVVRDGRIAEARHACELGVRWFAHEPATATHIGGRPASVGAVTGFVATFLASASRPLIYLAPDLSCAAQREAVALADALGALLDSVTSASALGSVLAAQERGRAGATLGEIRNRADVLLFWGSDPAPRYPRFLSRYAPDPPGVHVPQGRTSRTVIAVDIGNRRGPADADLRIAVAPSAEADMLAALTTALVGSAIAGDRDRVPAVHDLARRLSEGRYTVVVADAEHDAGEPPRPDVSAALIALVDALNGVTRAALCPLRGGGNRNGAEAVMTWQTGYPLAVDFGLGHPDYRPYEGSARAQLLGGHVDAALIVGTSSRIPPDVRALLFAVPHVVIGSREAGSPEGAAAIDAGIAGIHEAGLAYRMDDVPVSLRRVIDGPPLVPELLRAVAERWRIR